MSSPGSLVEEDDTLDGSTREASEEHTLDTYRDDVRGNRGNQGGPEDQGGLVDQGGLEDQGGPVDPVDLVDLDSRTWPLSAASSSDGGTSVPSFVAAAGG